MPWRTFLTDPPPLSLQVNTAARMETSAKPGCVQLSSASAALLTEIHPAGLVLKQQGEMPVKGKVRGGGGMWGEGAFRRPS